MGTPENELERQKIMRFLRKIHSRATGEDPLQEGHQTRLDPDILEELETLLSLTNDSEETRPD